MQTFLPYSDFYKSGSILDQKRLGKQRVEVLQMLNKIRGITQGKGWSNHPCTKMWSKTPNALVEYGVQICHAWRDRGYKDTCLDKIKAHFVPTETKEMPSWLGDVHFHLSHKSMLIQKKPEFYSNLWPNVPNNLEYIWPV
jgi:hypothetical protein